MPISPIVYHDYFYTPTSADLESTTSHTINTSYNDVLEYLIVTESLKKIKDPWEIPKVEYDDKEII